MSFGYTSNNIQPKVGGMANRVSQSITPNLDQPSATVDALAKTVDDLRNSMSALTQSLNDSRLRERTATDWVRTYSIDTSLLAIPFWKLATAETGGRSFNSLTVVAVGGGTLQLRINDDATIPVSAGDRFNDEIIWKLEVTATTPATGTAKIRVNAYAGR